MTTTIGYLLEMFELENEQVELELDMVDLKYVALCGGRVVDES